MNRLTWRLALGIAVVMTVSLIFITALQVLFLWRELETLPPAWRTWLTEELGLGRFQANGLAADPEFSAWAQRFRRQGEVATWLGLALTGLLSVGLAVTIARWLGRPLAKVSAAATTVARGDLSARIELSPKQQRSDDQISRLAKDFNAMAQQLETTERERRMMIADVAHELRTPLTVMNLTFEAILGDLMPLDKESVLRLQRHGQLLTRVVQDLRTLSLAETGALALERRPADLALLVRDVLALYQAPAGAKGLRLRMGDDAPAELHATVDPQRVAQVLGNLLDNALRVTPEGGEVTVRLGSREAPGSRGRPPAGERRPPSGLRLSVEDSGPGIPEDIRPRVFERFVKGSDTQGGSGLGLAIVAALVRAHGGEVWAEERSPQGTRMVVELPAGD